MPGNGEYKHNHYVPEWYQRRFLPQDGREQKFFYLDLNPDKIPGTTKKRKDVLRWGPKWCFAQNDLYTVKVGPWENIDIEKFFFGHIDFTAESAVDYFANFSHPSVDGAAFRTFLTYMSLQKLRTPKGLHWLSLMSRSSHRNADLMLMQHIRDINCAVWTECVWQIADATLSATKFIVSDHPVTVYNRACPPLSKICKDGGDPDIWNAATHTIFPLSLEKILILSNLNWVRNPYQSEINVRPNPIPFRDAMFNFTHIQTGRKLSEQEVLEINFIIKKRALRYVAAAEREWLYPENKIPTDHWKKLGDGYLLMPDPREISLGGEVVIGYENGRSDAFSEYGHKPTQPGFRDKKRQEIESKTLYRFKGEFSRLYGRKKRGKSFDFGGRERETRDEYSEEYHQYLLECERKHLRQTGRRRSQGQ